MFASILMELKPAAPGEVVGDDLHRWFLAQVHARDRDLARRLHDPRAAVPRPFALWYGRRFDPTVPPSSRVGHRDPLRWLRISTVDPTLTPVALDIARAVSSRTLTLGQASFISTGAFADGTHPWTRTASVADFAQRWLGGPTPPGRVSLRFLSPTTFSRGRGAARTTSLLPTGELVFTSLLRSWRAATASTNDDAAHTELLERVREEDFNLRSGGTVRFETHRLKGCVGVCEYSCGSSASPEAKRLLHLLADFASLAGVGSKRTMGMGQVMAARL